MSVYFVGATFEGKLTAIKIGRAQNPASRMRGLVASSFAELTLLAEMLSSWDARLERALHVEFAADRIRSEWFRPSEALLARIRAIQDGSWVSPYPWKPLEPVKRPEVNYVEEEARYASSRMAGVDSNGAT